MKKIRVLHITKDDKFFDDVFANFVSDERLVNKAVLHVEHVKGYKFQRIKNIDKVQLVENEDMKKCLKEGQYDVVFFYSLIGKQYKYFRWIPKDKIIIWWGWGYELYANVDGATPFIPIRLYKKHTEELLIKMRGEKRGIKQFLKYHILRHYRDYERRKVLKRIDYFQPVIPMEYQLMKRVKGFKAKEFYYPRYFTELEVQSDLQKDKIGNILIGNSQAPTNNHLDVWNSVKQFIPSGRKVIFPFNYGAKEYADAISKEINSECHDLMFLRNFMPSDEYFRLMDSCSYAVFGVLRQQAMGNIEYCLSHGIKIFLYRDSIVYRFLKQNGYAVYAIEDIDEYSFSTPMTNLEIEQNANAIAKEAEYIDKVRNNMINEIINIVDNL